MAQTNLIIGKSVDAESAEVEITGVNTVTVHHAKMNDRVLLFTNGASAGVIDRHSGS